MTALGQTWQTGGSMAPVAARPTDPPSARATSAPLPAARAGGPGASASGRVALLVKLVSSSLALGGVLETATPLRQRDQARAWLEETATWASRGDDG